MNKLTAVGIIAVGLYVAHTLAKAATAAAEAIPKADIPAPIGVPLLSRNGQLVRPIGADLASSLNTITDTRALGGLGESFSALPEGDGGMGMFGMSAPPLMHRRMPSKPISTQQVRKSAWQQPTRSNTPRAVSPALRALLNAKRRISGLGDAPVATGGPGSPVDLPMVINPYDADNAARVLPWWANRAEDQLNYATPVDPYNLQPVNSRGDAVNIAEKRPVHTGSADCVVVEEHGMVAEPAEVLPYVEPGDSGYGDMTTTDYGDQMESNTYNVDPGAQIGLRQN